MFVTQRTILLAPDPEENVRVEVEAGVPNGISRLGGSHARSTDHRTQEDRQPGSGSKTRRHEFSLLENSWDSLELRPLLDNRGPER
jgi:hypothetical protein